MNERQKTVLEVSKNRVKMLISDISIEIGTDETVRIKAALLLVLREIESYERAVELNAARWDDAH